MKAKSGTKISIDNTSSVPIVLSGRGRRRRTKMAKHSYEVEFKGVKIRCETEAEAISLARRLGESAESPMYAPWSMHEFTEFVERIQVVQRRLLAALLEKNGQPAKDFELRGKLGLKTNQALAGVLSGITKVAQAMEIDPRRVYMQRTEYNKGLPERRYYVSFGFSKAAGDADWPSESDLKDVLESLDD